MEEKLLRGKHPSDSAAKFTRILTHANMNGAGRLWGGDLLAWMDDTAAVAARRHAEGPVTTACIEQLRFLRPAYQNETIATCARVIHTGNTSMDVFCTADTEAFDGSRTRIAEGHFILVALDENERPKKVVPVVPITPEEQALFAESAAKRQK